MSTQCSPGRSEPWVLHTIAVGYVSTMIFGRECLATTSYVRGTSAGRAIAGAISRPYASSLVVVDDVATFVDLEHRLGFVVDDHVHGLREWLRKVYIDAQVTLLHQVEVAAVARVRC